MKMLIAGAALVVALAPLTLAISASAAASATVVYGDNGSANWHDPDLQPPGFLFGAGGFYITRPHWSHWGALNARASGIIHVCPSSSGCTRHRGTMYLHGVRSHQGRQYFQKMTVRWPNNVQRLTYGRTGGTAVVWH